MTSKVKYRNPVKTKKRRLTKRKKEQRKISKQKKAQDGIVKKVDNVEKDPVMTVRQMCTKKQSMPKIYKNLGFVYNLNKATPAFNEEKKDEGTSQSTKNTVKFADKLAESFDKRRENIKKSKTIRLSLARIQFITTMLNKYGEDYEAMTTDLFNYDQHTPLQMKKMVDKFKISEHYPKYLKLRKLV